MPRVRRPRVGHVTRGPLVVAVSGLLAGVLLTACSGTEDSSSTGPTTGPSEAVDSGTPLQALDTTALVVARAPFCDLVDPAAVTQALGEEPADVSEHRSGQRIRISDDVADVVHEYGCRWTAGDDTAEAWIFAPPVTRARAASLAQDVRREDSCAEPSAEVEFGRPSATCVSQGKGARTVSFRGLFGDAWLTCSLTLTETPVQEVEDRATRWCAAVATGAAGGDQAPRG